MVDRVGDESLGEESMEREEKRAVFPARNVRPFPALVSYVVGSLRLQMTVASSDGCFEDWLRSVDRGNNMLLFT